MMALAKHLTPRPSDGRGVGVGRARSTPQASSRVCRNEAMLEVGESVFSDDTIRALIVGTAAIGPRSLWPVVWLVLPAVATAAVPQTGGASVVLGSQT